MSVRPGAFGIGDEERYAYDQPEVHDIYRRWRAVLDSYPGDRMATGEVWVRDPAALARYVRPDELHLAFNFRYLSAPWEAPALRAAIDTETRGAAGRHTRHLGAVQPRRVRHRTRLGSLARARAATLLMLALPGAAYLYNGEELGLPEVECRRRRCRTRNGFVPSGSQPTRDGARVPMPWSGDAPPYGFSPAETSRRGCPNRRTGRRSRSDAQTGAGRQHPRALPGGSAPAPASGRPCAADRRAGSRRRDSVLVLRARGSQR